MANLTIPAPALRVKKAREQILQIPMGLRRTVSGGIGAQGFVGQRTDHAGETAAGKIGGPGLGERRGDKSAGAEFRAYLFHAEGRGGAVELRAVSRHGERGARVAGGRPEGVVAG